MLRRKGYYVWRIPSSGSRPSKKLESYLPDVFAVNKRKRLLVAFEVKLTNRNTITIPKYQVRKIIKFINGFPSVLKRKAVVAVYFAHEKKWVFKEVFRIDDVKLSVTDVSNVNL